MATELRAPFGLNPSGGIAAFSVPGDMVQAHLQSLVSTNPGERVMQPVYGVPLAQWVFGISAQTISPMVVSQVTKAIQKWEPSVNLQGVETQVADTSQGKVAVNVTYSPGVVATGSAQLTTASVLVGGTVVGG